MGSERILAFQIKDKNLKNHVNLKYNNKNLMENTIIKTRVVGVDVGIERTTFAIVGIRGNIIAADQIETLAYPDVNDYVSVLCEKITQLMINNGGIETVRSIGVSAPSANFLTGCIENPPNLPWKGVVPLAAMMSDRLGLAVGLANDAHTTAHSELAFGSAHGMKDFITITIGTGLGSCVFSGGREHQGADGYAGEIGHTCIAEKGRLCGCGHEGCLEAYVAAKGIVQTAKDLMAKSDEPSLMRDIEKLSPRIITECCNKGDKMAIEVYRRTGKYLGMALANYASIINPQAIIIAGGIAQAGQWLLKPACEAFEDHVFGCIKGKVKILASTIDNRIRDVLGASAVAWEVKEYSLFK